MSNIYGVSPNIIPAAPKEHKKAVNSAPPVANQLIATKYREFHHSRHVDHVNEVQSTLRYEVPQTFAHLAYRAKTEQIKYERTAQIEKENTLLLNKMRTIMNAGPTMKQKVVPFLKGHSLNRQARKLTMVKVMKDNLALLHRIQKLKPVYQVKQWEQEHLKREKLLLNMCKYPYYSPWLAPPGESTTTSRAVTAGSQTRLPKLGFSGSGQNTAERSMQSTRGDTGNVESDCCIFSDKNVKIGGIVSTVSVYEHEKPLSLSIIARDDSGRSSCIPIKVSYRELRLRFSENPDILAPENTNAMVRALIPALWWHERGATLHLQLSMDKVALPAPNTLPHGVSDKVHLAVICKGSFTQRASKPRSRCETAVYLWFDNSGNFKYVDRTESVESLFPGSSKSQIVFQKELCVPISNTFTVRVDVCDMQNGNAKEVLGSINVKMNTLLDLTEGSSLSIKLNREQKYDGSADDAEDIILRRIGMLDHVLTPEYVDMLTGSTRDGSGKSSFKTRGKSRPKTTGGATLTGASGEQQDKGLRGDGSQKDEKNDSYDEFDEPESGSSSSSASKAKI